MAFPDDFLNRFNDDDLKELHAKVHPQAIDWTEKAIASSNNANVSDEIYMTAFCISTEIVRQVPYGSKVDAIDINDMLRVAVVLGYRLASDHLSGRFNPNDESSG